MGRASDDTRLFSRLAATVLLLEATRCFEPNHSTVTALANFAELELLSDLATAHMNDVCLPMSVAIE